MIEVVFFDVGDTLVSQGAWVPGAKTCVARVRDAGLRVGLVSNTGTLSRAEVGDLLPPDFDLGEFEDSLVSLSSELGVEKPSLRIFQQAVARSGVAAADCIFFSESLTDVLAAQAAGLRGGALRADGGDLAGLIEALETSSLWRSAPPSPQATDGGE